MDVAQRDRRYLARDEAAEGVQFARSESSFIFDQHGKKYLDFTVGWCVGNLGWGNEEIRAAVRDFDAPTYVHPDYLYRGWAELAEGLAEIAPGKLTKCYRATGGSEAVEIAMQVAMAATGRPGFVSLAGCYHGNTIGGPSPAAGNLISASGGDGISLVSSHNTVQGNTVGTDATGTVAFSNLIDGIGSRSDNLKGSGFCQQAVNTGGSDNLIGGTAAGDGNLISGNAGDGVDLVASNRNVIAGNRVGTNRAGTGALGNGQS